MGELDSARDPGAARPATVDAEQRKAFQHQAALLERKAPKVGVSDGASISDDGFKVQCFIAYVRNDLSVNGVEERGCIGS